MQPKVIFEDESVLLLDKPAGWVVNESGTTGTTPVIQTWLCAKYNFETAKDKEFRSGIVHRLDKETSGLLIIAKTRASFVDLQRQFKQRVVKKRYIALAHGEFADGAGSIVAPVGRLPWRRERFGILPGGREAETDYKLVAVYRDREKEKAYYSLVELYPKTGRTHQIRIHLKHLGHPIVADTFYAGRKTARADRKWCPRLFLHASEISFIHPQNRGEATFASDLPADLDRALATLEKVGSRH